MNLDFTPEEKEDQSDLFAERASAPEPSGDTSDIVQLFDSVTYLMLKDGGKQEKRSVQIVPSQGDPNGGTIGQHSAIGRALLGARKGDEIEAALPVGEVSLIIKEIDKAPENVRKAS